MNIVFFSDVNEISNAYPLRGNNNISKPIEGIRKNDDGSLDGYTMVSVDPAQLTASHITEMIEKNALPFDTPDEYNKWLLKNPIEVDEKGVPIVIDKTSFIESVLSKSASTVEPIAPEAIQQVVQEEVPTMEPVTPEVIQQVVQEDPSLWEKTKTFISNLFTF